MKQESAMIGASSSIDRVRSSLAQCGLSSLISELPASTRTAAEAAAALNCEIAQIAKSIIFEATPSRRAVLVIISGAKRVDEKCLEEQLGEKIKKASADFVLETTGFVIGGVSPLGSIGPLIVYFDRSLLEFEHIWAAAGTPHAVFRTTPSDLQKAVDGRVVSISR